MARPVVVREVLPVSPERAFQLFTAGPSLSRWFCDAADSDVQPGGEVHAAWVDEDGETWERVGHWAELDPPHKARLEWFDVETAADAEAKVLSGDTQVVLGGPAPETAPENAAQTAPAEPVRDYIQIAIAPHPEGCMVTLMSPVVRPQGSQVPAETLFSAVERGWQQCFEAVRDLAAQDA